jgi:hypothetical protein
LTPPSKSADDSLECSICGLVGAGGTKQNLFPFLRLSTDSAEIRSPCVYNL